MEGGGVDNHFSLLLLFRLVVVVVVVVLSSVFFFVVVVKFLPSGKTMFRFIHVFYVCYCVCSNAYFIRTWTWTT